MAEKITLTCDAVVDGRLCGREPAVKCAVEINGSRMEMDLCDEHVDHLRTVASWGKASRRASGQAVSTASRRRSAAHGRGQQERELRAVLESSKAYLASKDNDGQAS